MNKGTYSRIIKSNTLQLEEFCSKNEYVYRFLPIGRLVEMLDRKVLTFVSPTKWNDPFDNFLFKQVTSNASSFLNRWYVLCFTHNPHSQAYWKTYSPDGHCVRIRIRSKVLIDLLLNIQEKVWLGKMNYEFETELVEILQNTKGLRSSLSQEEPNDIFLKTFHLKRMPFKYEEESRISILTDSARGNGLRKISIIPEQVISEIYLDPKMDEFEVIAWKEYFSKCRIPVKKSLLFKEKKIKIQ